MIHVHKVMEETEVKTSSGFTQLRCECLRHHFITCNIEQTKVVLEEDDFHWLP
jgi:hypothetical protein